MAKPLDPFIVDVLKKFGFGKDAIWDCHGTLVVYHRILEQIAAKAGISFDLPLPLETSGAAKSVALCVRGTMAERSEWSIGEASPGNNKNSYPYAMAEKRAKDRVILKLIGLHGLVYSEEEADDFQQGKEAPKPITPTDTPQVIEWKGPLKVTNLKNKLRDLASAVRACDDPDELGGIEIDHKEILEQAEHDLPEWYTAARKAINDRAAMLMEHKNYINAG